MAEIGYRSEIDGLRAVAVLPVILFHMSANVIPGGYLGVDVFFVISGFLITSIMKQELDEGTFSLRRFWARRIRRILPAMALVTLCTLLVSFAAVFLPDQRLIGQQAVAALFSVANLFFWRSSNDYWSSAAEESPFLHMWSLSVEEQFYLIFPIATLLIFRFRPRWLSSCVLATVVGSLALYLWALNAYPTAAFYLLPTRAWELGSGSLLALTLGKRNSHTTKFNGLAIAGLGLVISSYFLFKEQNAGVILTVLGSVLIIAFGQSGLSHRLLSWRPLVHIGKISYSLYLWHWPVLVAAKSLDLDSTGLRDMAILSLVIYLLSVATYHLVENPTRRRVKIIPPLLTGYVAVIALAAVVTNVKPPVDANGFSKPTYYGVYYNLQPRGLSEEFDLNYSDWNLPPRESPADAFFKGGVIVGSQPDKPEIVVLGDSQGLVWAHTIRSVTEDLGITTSFYSSGGVTPFVKLPLKEGRGTYGFTGPEKLQYDSARLEYIKKWQPKVVIVCAAWSRRKEADTAGLLDFLEEHVPHVLLVEQPPIPLDLDRNNSLRFLVSRGVLPQGDSRQYWPAGNWDTDDNVKGQELLSLLVEKHKNCKIVRVHDLYYDNGKTLVLDGSQVIYLDFLHLSEHGAQLARDRFRQSLETIFAD